MVYIYIDETRNEVRFFDDFYSMITWLKKARKPLGLKDEHYYFVVPGSISLVSLIGDTKEDSLSSILIELGFQSISLPDGLFKE